MNNIAIPIPIKKLDNQRSTEISFIPKSEFMCLMTGAISKGKTTLLINLLQNPDALANRFNKIIIVSTTATLDSKWSLIIDQGPKIVKANKELLKAILKQKKKRKTQLFDNEDDLIFDELIETVKDRCLTKSDFIEETSLSFLPALLEEQKKSIEKYGKELANNILLVLDDCASDKKAFKDQTTVKTIFMSRHYKISSIITTQAYFQICKSIRLNCGFKVIFHIANQKELQVIYAENNCGIDWPEWQLLYNEVNDVDHQFVSINLYNPKGSQMSRNFEEFL
jgi:hypothetical protein